MEYVIFSKDHAIGKIVAPEADFGMGVVIGLFVPFPAYERVQPLFRRFMELASGGTSQANREQFDHWYQERDSLGLSIMTNEGRRVNTIWINIIDGSEVLSDEGYQAEFCVSSAFFQDASLWS